MNSNTSADFQALLSNHSPATVKPNAFIEATVSEVTKDGAFVIIPGLKVEGHVPTSEMPEGGLTAGNSYTFLVVHVPVREDEHVELSSKQATAWQDVQALLKDGTVEEVVVGKVLHNRETQRCPGVLTYIRGIEAFIPYSHLSTGGLPTDQLLGATLKVKVITCDFDEGRVVLSNREAVEASRDQHLASLTPGSIVQGRIANVVDYGAFVDIGCGVRGLVHVSELSSRRTVAKEAVKPGESVEVVVLSCDAQTGRVSLSIKKAKQAKFFNVLKTGEQRTGKIARILEYGAFVQLDECTDGLLHISRIPGGSRGLATLSPEQEVLVEIIELDTDRMKVGLSLVA